MIANATHCAICGEAFVLGDLIEADHIVPRVDGGPDSPANYQATHRHCNRKRGRNPLLPQKITGGVGSLDIDGADTPRPARGVYGFEAF